MPSPFIFLSGVIILLEKIRMVEEYNGRTESSGRTKND